MPNGTIEGTWVEKYSILGDSILAIPDKPVAVQHLFNFTTTLIFKEDSFNIKTIGTDFNYEGEIYGDYSISLDTILFQIKCDSPSADYQKIVLQRMGYRLIADDSLSLYCLSFRDSANPDIIIVPLGGMPWSVGSSPDIELWVRKCQGVFARQ